MSVYSISVIGQTRDPKLNFDTNNFSLKTISFKTKILKVKAYENIVYVSNPFDTIYQKINIYILEKYFRDKIINGYNELDAPIFLPNQIGGYMPARPGSTEAQGWLGQRQTRL